MDKETILGFTPWPELLIRRVYYSKNIYLRRIMEICQQKYKNGVKDKLSIPNQRSKERVIEYLEKLGISKGDIVIVHSSIDNLASLGIDAMWILNYLRKRVGNDGTLVLPTFPLYNEKNRLDEGSYLYNPKKTISATGLITNIFLRMPGVIRSRFPWNTLAAQGPLAEKMMEKNMETDLAHGKNSAWEFCMNHHAKILFLGVRASHTTTMVHVAEDILDDLWPIKNWYENKTFYIQDGENKEKKTIRIRKNEWVKYNASWYRSVCLAREGILTEKRIKGIDIGYIEDSKVLVDYIVKRTLLHKSFFVVPKKDYKQ